MNDERRKTVSHLIDRLTAMSTEAEAIIAELDTVQKAEQAAFDSRPEKLQNGAEGQKSQLAASDLEDAVTTVEDIPAILLAVTDSLRSVVALSQEAADRASNTV